MNLSPEEAQTILASLMEKSDALLLMRLDHQGYILDCSPSLKQLIAPSEEIKHTRLENYIARESEPGLKRLLQNREPAILHLPDHEDFICSFLFRTVKAQQDLLLLGVPVRTSQSPVIESMTKERNKTHKVLLDRISAEADVYDRLRDLIRNLRQLDVSITHESLISELNEIGVLLDSLALTNRSPSLTPQERKVLTLLIEKRSNREIADRLYVSLPTIKTHIASIYRKLGVRSRKELRELQAKG